MTLTTSAGPRVLGALLLARHDFPAFALQPGGKKPLRDGWPDRATTDPQTIGQEWQACPEANVGYTLDGRVGIDLDTVVGHGVDGEATWTGLVDGRALPRTWTVRTPTGGLHLVFELPAGVAVRSGANKLGPGVDVKSGRGAYLVGPGSVVGGVAYELVDDTPPAPVPAWLLELLLAAEPRRSEPIAAPAPGAAFVPAPRPWQPPRERLGAPIPVGQRHDELMRYACSMRERRLSEAEASVLLRARLDDCEQASGDPFGEAEALALLHDVWQRYPVGTKKEETTSVAVQAFHGVLGEIVQAAAPYTEADPVGVLVSLLAGVAVLVGEGPHLTIGATRHPLLVWPLLLGRTGAGRKGDATEVAFFFLLSSYPGLVHLHVSGLSSGEGLIERLRDAKDENDVGTTDKRLLVFEPEFASVMARARREGSTLAAVLRQAWDGRALSVLNREKLHASGSHVSILAHTTPREFRLRLAESEMAGGTCNRFLPVYVERSKRLPIPQPIPEEVVGPLAERLGEAITAAKLLDRVVLGPDAEYAWCHGLYEELTAADDEDRAWSEFTRRAAPYCLRIAALYAVLDGRAEIDQADLAAAAALVRYSIGSARLVLDGQGRDHRLDKIRSAIDVAPNGLTRTEITELFSRNLPAAVLDELLGQLLATEDYAMTEDKTGGRPARRYRRTKKEETTP